MRRALAGLGRTLVTAGVLILLFVAYQLWGTGIYEAREQDRLRDQLKTKIHRAPDIPVASPEVQPPPPPTGEAIARLKIPKIGVDTIVVNGVSREDLRKGPGHYPTTPLPGQRGNAAIAGHRTTYGAPFGNLDQLSKLPGQPGDLIIVRTIECQDCIFHFRLIRSPFAVNPSDLSVLDPIKENPNDPNSPDAATLTLTTCTPKYSAAQRLIVQAKLVPDEQARPAPELPRAKPNLSGNGGSKLPTIITGLIAALVGLLWWLLFHRHPRWTNWLLGAVPFAVALFFFYSYLERVLPANY